MPYTDHFRLADDYISHLDKVMDTIGDPFIKSRYSGFLAISAVTVYELALKNVFIDFANQTHHMLGVFTANFFDRINGRIRVREIKEKYIQNFGDKYLRSFADGINRCEEEILRNEGSSIISCYENIITWRNSFAHEGRLPDTCTYEEVKRAYACGKHVLHCLDGAMR